MSLDYNSAQESFNEVLCKLHPWVLSNFIMWLDLKIAEYKVFGQIVVDKGNTKVAELDEHAWKAIQKSRDKLKESQNVQTQQNIGRSQPTDDSSDSIAHSSTDGKSSIHAEDKPQEILDKHSRTVSHSNTINTNAIPEHAHSHSASDKELQTSHIAPQRRIRHQILSSSGHHSIDTQDRQDVHNPKDTLNKSKKIYETSENTQEQFKLRTQKPKEISNREQGYQQTDFINLDTDDDSKDEDEFYHSASNMEVVESEERDQNLNQGHTEHGSDIRDEKSDLNQGGDGCGSCVKLQSQIESLQNWMKRLEGNLISSSDTTQSPHKQLPRENPRKQSGEKHIQAWQANVGTILHEPQLRQEDAALTDEDQMDNIIFNDRFPKKSKQTSVDHLDTSRRPRAGVLNQKIAARWQMVELQTGSNVYIHYQQWINAVAKDPTKAACYLMSCFWKKEELKGMTLTGVRNSRRLNPDIVHTIINFCLSKPGGSGKLAEIKRAMRNKIGDSGRIRSVLHGHQRSSSQSQSSMAIELSTISPDNMLLWQQSPENMKTLQQSSSYNIQRYTGEDTSQGLVAEGWNPDEDQGAQLQHDMFLKQEGVHIVVKQEPSEDSV